MSIFPTTIVVATDGSAEPMKDYVASSSLLPSPPLGDPRDLPMVEEQGVEEAHVGVCRLPPRHIDLFSPSIEVRPLWELGFPDCLGVRAFLLNVHSDHAPLSAIHSYHGDSY